ncbi:ras-related protein Rab-33B-like isoform X2 [Pseudoliparis swirei]|uniref:ras-related protein Rab-33B-like isoform X2 n=1 Tax=Pseudoliparis swirei TaxID=2059687 RepID=UPI0024BE0F9F|nr:ras-related protein Rab-33B-like isoform X2 [Pseudoliparis swirei]
MGCEVWFIRDESFAIILPSPTTSTASTGHPARCWPSSSARSASSCQPLPCCCSRRPLHKRWRMPPQSPRRSSGGLPALQRTSVSSQEESALSLLIECVCVVSPVQFVVQLQIWDTAGQERFRKSMVEHYYRNVHAVIFVYDVTSLSSFESVPEWIEECSRHCVGPLVPRVMVGNKCDLKDRREVPTTAAQCLADSYNFPLFETSAKEPAEKEHVDAIFLTLAYRLKSHKLLRLKQLSESGGGGGGGRPWDQRGREAGTCQC